MKILKKRLIGTRVSTQIEEETARIRSKVEAKYIHDVTERDVTNAYIS